MFLLDMHKWPDKKNATLRTVPIKKRARIKNASSAEKRTPDCTVQDLRQQGVKLIARKEGSRTVLFAFRSACFEHHPLTFDSCTSQSNKRWIQQRAFWSTKEIRHEPS